MQTTVKCVFLFLFFFFSPLLFLIFFAYASQHGLSLLLVVFLTTRKFQFLAECGKRRASWYATTKIIFIQYLHLYIFHWISCIICKILFYRAVVEFVWKLRFFGRNSLKRTFFHVYAEGNSQGSSIHFDPTSENLSSLLPTAVWISKIFLAGVRWSYYTNTI